MTKQVLLRLGALALAAALAGCGGHGSSSSTPAPAAPASFQSGFGTSFAAAYDTDRNGNAIDPSNSDVPALNLSAEPKDN